MNIDSVNRPVGIFDSGIGGLTVVSAVRKLLPNESVYYIGDTARVPYGGKSEKTVQRYSREIAALLVDAGCKAIVVACNTASSVALETLRAATPLPVLGVINPGARAAVGATRNGHIGVIGTRATIRSGAYERAIQALRPDAQVTSRACPLLVPLIEEGRLDGAITAQVVEEYLEPLLDAKIDALVLGCTHYPLLREVIQAAVGSDVVLVDSAENCALALRYTLEGKELAAAEASADPLRVALTDLPDHFLRVAEKALQLRVGEPQLCELAH